jgi:hypothetical protein
MFLMNLSPPFCLCCYYSYFLVSCAVVCASSVYGEFDGQSLGHGHENGLKGVMQERRIALYSPAREAHSCNPSALSCLLVSRVK